MIKKLEGGLTLAKKRLYIRRRIKGKCWLYIGATRNGYGHVTWPGFKTQYVHCIAAIIWLGVKPEEIGRTKDKFRILHKCNTPLCWRPSHLYKGTNSSNMQDARRAGTIKTFREMPELIRKGNETMRREPWRRARGDRHPFSLHPELVPRGDNHWKRRLKVASS